MPDNATSAEMVGARASVHRGLSSAVAVLNRLNPVIRGVSVIGMALFVAMVILTFVDVILRYVFDRPLPGTIEITELLMLIVVFTGVAYTQLGKAHVIMDVVTINLKPKAKTAIEGFTNLLVIAVLVLVIWKSLFNAMTTSETTMVLSIPINGFAALVPFGSILLILVVIRDYLRNLADSLKYEGHAWPWMIFGPIVLVAICAYLVAAHPADINLPLLGIIGVILMLAFFCTGMPIAFVLMGLGIVLVMYIRGPEGGYQILETSWYRTVGSYSWSPIMFFILMGFVCFYSRFGEDLFLAANRFMGHMKGGLGMGAVAACAAFGAVVGDTLTGTIAMTAIGLPEMRRYKYSDVLAIGTLTCSGTLGTLIPPSIAFILYGVLAEQSIGDLFIAGIIPGLVCAFLFMLTVYIRCVRNPSLGPPTPRSSWGARMSSLKAGGPILALFLLVIIGIYAGIFTATEGGGIGCFGAFVFALGLRRLNWKSFSSSLVESAKFCAMSFTLLGGAMMFGYFIAISRLPMEMADFVASLQVHPMVIMAIIVVIFFILGCFIPAIPMILICVPIFLPIAQNLHWDLIWFGVIMVLMFNMAAITPPFGINLFVMKGFTGVPMSLVYRSALPYVASLVFVIIIMVVFPPISTWLPSLFH